MLGDYVFDDNTLIWIKNRINHMHPKPLKLYDIAENICYDPRTTFEILEQLDGIMIGEFPNASLVRFLTLAERKKGKTRARKKSP